MAVTQTVTLTKDGATFGSATEAANLFISECDADSQLTTNKTYNENAIESGDMIESIALTSSNDGFVVTRTWTDAKYAEAQSTKSPLTLGSGWTKTNVIS
tara:strand:+ start:3986 stop:4285 length:300 start_codon:yes stop_codon:yes gene_type:complete